MKCKQLLALLESIADFLSANEAKRNAHIVASFFPVLKAMPNFEVSKAIGVFSEISIPAKETPSEIDTLLSIINASEDLLQVTSGKNVLKAIQCLKASLLPFRHCGLEDFVAATAIAAEKLTASQTKSSRSRRDPALSSSTKRRVSAPAALRLDLIETYQSRLEGCLNDEVGFKDLHGEISKRGVLSELEAKELARRFYGDTGKTKADALNNILRRQQKLLQDQATEKASGGRIAA